MTILTKEVTVRWHNLTKKYYEELGYEFTGCGNEFTVPVEHLHRGSKIKVLTKCDYCHKELNIQFNSYNNKKQSSEINKNACLKCSKDKEFEIAELLNSRGELTKDSKYYYRFKNNREAELIKHIEEFGNLDNFRDKNQTLYLAFFKYDIRTLHDVVAELGYNWDDLSQKNPVNYHKDLNNVKQTVDKFYNKHGYFPTSVEMYRDLKIQLSAISFHGGVHELKRKLGYDNEMKHVDDRGYENLSHSEYTVAQFLIKNNISYKREQPIVNDLPYRCDFFIATVDNIHYYVEVWGYDKKNKNELSVRYNEGRAIKEKLYNDNKLNLISIEFAELNKLNYLDKQNYLIEKFSFLKGLELKEYDDVSYLQPKNLTDDYIINKIMELSDDKKLLPTVQEIKNNGLETLYIEIIKRFKSYHKFAEFHNKEPKMQKVEKWTMEEIFKVFKEIMESNQPINTTTLSKLGKMGIYNFLTGKGDEYSITSIKLNFFYESVDENTKTISKEDIKFIIQASEGIVTNRSKLTDKGIKDAKDIVIRMENNKFLSDKVRELKIKLAVAS